MPKLQEITFRRGTLPELLSLPSGLKGEESEVFDLTDIGALAIGRGPTNEPKILWNKPRPQSGIPITHGALRTAISGSSLVPGQVYKITDYKTVYVQATGVGTSTVKSDAADEPLLVEAIANNAISQLCWSETHIEDLIIYDVDDILAEDSSTARKGFIKRRMHPPKNIDVSFDWRAMKFILAKATLPTTYNVATDYDAGDLAYNSTTDCIVQAITDASGGDPYVDTEWNIYLNKASLSHLAANGRSVDNITFGGGTIEVHLFTTDLETTNISNDITNVENVYIGPVTSHSSNAWHPIVLCPDPDAKQADLHPMFNTFQETVVPAKYQNVSINELENYYSVCFLSDVSCFNLDLIHSQGVFVITNGSCERVNIGVVGNCFLGGRTNDFRVGNLNQVFALGFTSNVVADLITLSRWFSASLVHCQYMTGSRTTSSLSNIRGNAMKTLGSNLRTTSLNGDNSFMTISDTGALKKLSISDANAITATSP